MNKEISKLTGTGVIPEHAPPYSHGWSCPEAHAVNVTVSGSETALKKILSFTPFEYVTNRFQIWIGDLKRHTVAESSEGYKESGVVVPVRYQGITAGYTIYMYSSDFAAILAGREVFGLPKKYADIKFIETEIGAVAVVMRRGIELIKIGFSFVSSEKQPEELTEVEKLNRGSLMMKAVPKADEEGAAFRQIIFRDVARKVHDRRPGKAVVTLGELPGDPIYALGVEKIIGATYTVSSFGGGGKSETIKVLANL